MSSYSSYFIEKKYYDIIFVNLSEFHFYQLIAKYATSIDEQRDLALIIDMLLLFKQHYAHIKLPRY